MMAAEFSPPIDFNVLTYNNIIMGISLTGQTIPPGINQVLTTITFSNFSESICFSGDTDINTTIQDTNGNNLATSWGECFDLEECGAELADVNGDSQINILDLVQIANLVIEVSTPDYECAAGYNQDGQVNILDLVQIANYILDN